MTRLLCLLLLIATPCSIWASSPWRPESFPRIESSCTLLEVNHVYDDDARFIFTQLIFRDWMGIQAWCMADKGIVANGRVYLKSGMVIHYDRLEVTHSQYDRELADRDRLPVDQRRIMR